MWASPGHSFMIVNAARVGWWLRLRGTTQDQGALG